MRSWSWRPESPRCRRPSLRGAMGCGDWPGALQVREDAFSQLGLVGGWVWYRSVAQAQLSRVGYPPGAWGQVSVAEDFQGHQAVGRLLEG